MVSDYDLSSFLLDDNQIQSLYDYYANWNYSGIINLKFRFVKLFGYYKSDKKPSWLLLNQFVNKRRIYNDKLKSYILYVLDHEFVPIRIFHSVCEWIAPNEVFNHKNDRLFRSGIFPFENDDSLKSSIKSAIEVSKIIKGKKLFVFSGNKSVHVWWLDFDVNDYLNPKEISILWSQKNREKLERKARERAFYEIQKKVSFELDYRNAVDSRRIVPIIGSINGFTGRIVTQLKSDELKTLNSESLKQRTKIIN